MFVGLFLGGTAALATWLLFPRQFEVEAILQFENVADYLGGDKYVNPEDIKKYRETQLYLVSSDWLLQAALRDPKVANLSLLQGEDEPIYFLRKSLNVFSPRDSNLMIIRMKEEEPRDMVTIVRAITQKYLENAVAEARDKRMKRLRFSTSNTATTKSSCAFCVRKSSTCLKSWAWGMT